MRDSLKASLELFYLQCPQIFFLLRCDPVTFDSLLDGLVVSPWGKSILLDEGNRRVPLLGKSCGEEPSYHHLHVILLAPYWCRNFKIFCLEVFVQIMSHKCLYSKPASEGMLRADPSIYLFYQCWLTSLIISRVISKHINSIYPWTFAAGVWFSPSSHRKS